MRDVRERQGLLRLGLTSLVLIFLSGQGYVSVVGWTASFFPISFGLVPLFAAPLDESEATDKTRNAVQVEQIGDELRIKQVGKASWYGSYHHGEKTASGEKYDQHELTAAHPSLPLGTEAVVTNLETGESVEVEITDRGPYVKGREIDLSRAAAKEIGAKEDGIAPVKIEATIPAESVAVEGPFQLREKIKKRQQVKETTLE